MMLQRLRPMGRNSLGWQIMALLGTALFSTLILFSLSVFYFVNRTEAESWRGRQSEAARNASGMVSSSIERVHDAMLVIGIVESDHLVNDPDELYALLNENPALMEIIRVDQSGQVYASAFRDKTVLASMITIPQSEWFLQARQGQTFIGDVQLSAKNAPYLIMAVPSGDGGVVASRVQMDVLWEAVRNIHFGRSGQAYVIARGGNIVAHTDLEIVIKNSTLKGRPELASMLTAPSNEWYGSYTNFKGNRVVGYTYPIPGTDWLLVTELPMGEAFSATRSAILVLGAEAIILMLVVSLVVGRFIRVQVADPMERLQDGVNRVGHGELDYRIGMVREDEIGLFASAFDRMSASLQQREAQVEAQTMAIQLSESRYRAIVEDQTELICRFLPDGTLTFVNEAYCRYFNRRREDLIGHNFMPLIPEEDRKAVQEAFAALNPSNLVVTYEHRVILPDGTRRWQQWSDRIILLDGEQVIEYASVGRDITERKRAEEQLRHLNLELEQRVQERTVALRESEERYMLAVQGANDGIWDWNLKTNEIYFSPRWRAMLGYSEQTIGNQPDHWLQRIYYKDLPAFQGALSAHLRGETDHFESEYRMLDASQSYRWMLCRGLAIREENGSAYRMAGSQTDITDRKRVEERLAHDALHDALTGLPNRTLFVDRLQQRLEHGKRHRGDLFAILFLDLDRFKVINDSLGHAMGDQFLVITAQRLESCLRPDDTISRLGGDEFAILISEISDVSDAIRVAERIQARLRGTALLGSIHRTSTVSIGITIFNGNYTDPQEMLRDADSAMYRAKAQGGGRYQVFDVDMYKSALTLLQMETDLKRAVEQDEWQIHYQPVIHLASQKIVGLEALIRWNHPERGLVHPGDFIPLAEESGLIVPIGEYVLSEACQQAKVWRDLGSPQLWVSVNLSARQFQDRYLVKKVQHILQSTGLPGSGLRLEVTETVAMKDFEHSVKVLQELNELGIHLSLDDFGNGYSSLGYLKRFPIKSLKIDRSFIRDINANANSHAIASAIISLGHNLNLEVVAEGVETAEQYAFLKAEVCDGIQGFLFARPAPASEASGLILRQTPFIPGPGTGLPQ